MTNGAGGLYAETLSYEYDDRGYITRVEKDANNYSEYRYDALGQLMRENYKWGFISYTKVYAYDVGGNIMSKIKYDFVAGDGTVGDPVDTIAYTYDSTWKDKLASYDGDSITYDDIGNPLNDGTWTYTWTQGRKLSAISNGVTSASYKYNNSGIRTQKSVGGVTTVFNLAGSNITWQKTGTSDPIYFIYDSGGKLWGLKYEGNMYFYVRNAQGDIIKIIDSSGEAVVTYSYDAWGKLLITTDSSGVSLGVNNPFRYRGYYYDVETGLYYLNARYYNPHWGRFINADSYGGNVGGLLSHNVFTYCINNPVMYSDPSGNWLAEGISLRDSVFLPDGDKINRKIRNNNYTIDDVYKILYVFGWISYDELLNDLKTKQDYGVHKTEKYFGGSYDHYITWSEIPGYVSDFRDASDAYSWSGIPMTIAGPFIMAPDPFVTKAIGGCLALAGVQLTLNSLLYGQMASALEKAFYAHKGAIITYDPMIIGPCIVHQQK